MSAVDYERLNDAAKSLHDAAYMAGHSAGRRESDRHLSKRYAVALLDACGVCEAFGPRLYKNMKADLNDPLWVVFAWHEVPKIDMKIAEHQWSGPAAQEVYERTLQTYRAAGWEPVPDRRALEGTQHGGG